MSGLLFIGSNRIGDAVLSTGALSYAMTLIGAKEVTIACGPLAAPLFRAVPGLKALHPIEKRRRDGHWFALWSKLYAQRFDLAVDTRGTLLTYFVAAKRRFVHRKSEIRRHKVEEATELMAAPQPLAPRIWLDDAARAAAEEIVAGSAPILALGPGSNFIGKRWPPERFAAVARRLVSAAGPLANARIVILGGPEDRAIAEMIVSSLDADGVSAIDAAGKLDLLGGAALLARSTLFIGNDSGLMHIAAAAGAPTLGLFGPSDERQFGPWGARTRTLRGRAYEELMAEGHFPTLTRSLMEDITVDAAEAAAHDLLHAGGLL
ncbi:MAG: glycosyltransferase family 9 protein [Caulobacterales bacterium]